MPILNVKTENIGASGQNPSFIYIETTDTVGQVTSNGYLNDVVSQGIAISELQMAVVTTKTSPSARSTQTGLYVITVSAGSYTLNSYVGAGGDWDPAASWNTSGDWTNTGDWNFNGNVNFNTLSNIFMTSGGALGLNAVDDLDLFTSNGNMNLNSSTGSVNIQANNGDTDISGGTCSIHGNTQMNVYCADGPLSMNTTNGDLDIFCGTSATNGNVNFGCDHGNINIFVNNTGGIGLNTNGSSWGVSPAGISGGVAAGSGVEFDAVTGNVQFGASTGSFLIGALANTVDILSGTTMTLTANTKLDMEAAVITLSLITNETPVASAPTISLPAGFSYLVIQNSNKQIFTMG